MTRNEIISRLGWLHFSHIDGSPDSVLSRIEKLVADVAHEEREACAKVCEDRDMGDGTREDQEAKRCAEYIRARSAA